MSVINKAVHPALSKPLHLAVLKPTTLQTLAKEGKLPSQVGSLPLLPDGTAKVATQEAPPKFNIPKAPAVAAQVKHKVKLRLIYDAIPPLPEDQKPPCATDQGCKTAACCWVFLVAISEEEYESGVFGDHAVKITPEITQQLQNLGGLPVIAGGPGVVTSTEYYLEGKVGQPCPFLTTDARCGIYEYRPIVCRTYTCVGDTRITQAMRDGTAPLFPVPPEQEK